MNANFVLQDRFLERFFAGPLSGHFYLTGGTALARFYFHHRESLDLDLFTNDSGQDFARVNQAVLGIYHALELHITSQVVTDTYIQYIVADQIGVSLKVDLVKDVPVHFGEIGVKDGVRLDSLNNIGSNKVLAIFGRTDAKDFIDLYWILHNIEKILLFPRMLQPLPWEDMKVFFQALARALLERIKPN